jgi:hypothetical protein
MKPIKHTAGKMQIWSGRSGENCLMTSFIISWTLVTKCYYDEQIKEDLVGRTCSVHGEMRNVHKSFVRKPEGNTLWSSGWHSCFVFRRFRVQISARMLAILTGFRRSSVLSCKCALNLATTTSFHTLINPSFTYHPFVRRYVVLSSEKASLNKQ